MKVQGQPSGHQLFHLEWVWGPWEGGTDPSICLAQILLLTQEPWLAGLPALGLPKEGLLRVGLPAPAAPAPSHGQGIMCFPSGTHHLKKSHLNSTTPCRL